MAQVPISAAEVSEFLSSVAEPTPKPMYIRKALEKGFSAMYGSCGIGAPQKKLLTREGGEVRYFGALLAQLGRTDPSPLRIWTPLSICLWGAVGLCRARFGFGLSRVRAREGAQ